MHDSPHTPVLPVVLRASTTAEDAFEDVVEDYLRVVGHGRPPFRIEVRRAVPCVAKGKRGKVRYLRPDFRVVLVAPEVMDVLIADAKSGKFVTVSAVEDVIRYRRAFKVRTILFHPIDARVLPKARDLACKHNVELQPLAWHRPT